MGGLVFILWWRLAFRLLLVGADYSQGSLKKSLLVFGKIKQVDRRGLATSRRRSILFIVLDTAFGFQAAVEYRKKQSFQAAFG